MTPEPLAQRIVDGLEFHTTMRVLEPSFGEGAFLIPVIRRFLDLHDGTPAERLARVLRCNVWGVELDEQLYQVALGRIEEEFGPLPTSHNLVNADFFAVGEPAEPFDRIIGNPPFGGTFDPTIEDQLDRRYGQWDGHKLKKETYSFFIARSLEWLAPAGQLSFIASDTMLTIKTMTGLRRRLMDCAHVRIEQLPSFSEETNQGTLVLHAARGGRSDVLVMDGVEVDRSLIELTGNFSWGMDAATARYFAGPTLGDFVVGSGGMTIGRNELFVRKIRDGRIEEHLDFEFFDDPVTLEKELARARLGQLSARLQARIRAREAAGETQRNVRWSTKPGGPQLIELPHDDYRPYNKASSGLVYEEPRAAVFWRDDGDAVQTFKRNGNWYLRGVGGKPFFGRAGLTWQLVSPRINMRYLPEGYILDSGAPCAFLRDGADQDELWFILGWCLTERATRILKAVINHTRNIQGKDIERMPYPFWVDASDKDAAIALVTALVADARGGRRIDRAAPELAELERLYAFPETSTGRRSPIDVPRCLAAK